MSEEVTQNPVSRSNGLFNRTAIRAHALKVSRQTRNGKFTRVSNEFIDNVVAAVEAKIRSFPAGLHNAPLGQVDPDEGVSFLTGAGRARLAEQFNVWIAREIHRQVNNVRVGRTL